MIKIWIQTRKKDKLIKSIIYETEEFDSDNFDEILRDICNFIDVPTPVALSSHKRNYDKFGIVKFVRSDFIESVDFDSLVLETVKDKDEKKDDRNKPFTYEDVLKFAWLLIFL